MMQLAVRANSARFQGVFNNKKEGLNFQVKSSRFCDMICISVMYAPYLNTFLFKPDLFLNYDGI